MRRLTISLCALLILLSLPGFLLPVQTGAGYAPQANGDIFRLKPAVFTKPGVVNDLVPLSDGRVLAVGSFTSIAGQPAPHSLALIGSDGSLDAGFRVDPNLLIYEVNAAALQPDGKIVIAGWFTLLPSPGTYFLLRINPDGSLDDSFHAAGLNGRVYSILVDGDKILIGGNFSVPTARIARLNADGSGDPGFDGVGSGPDGLVRAIARQSTGKYILAGEFETVNAEDQVGLARLNADGSLDGAFAPGGFRSSKQVAVLNDDSVLVGGENVCGDGLFAWYTPAGAPKADLDPNPDLFQAITSFLPLPDGGFLIGGWSSGLCVNGFPVDHVGEVWRYAGDGSYRTMISYGSETDMFALAMRSDGIVIVGGQGRPETPADVGLFDGLAAADLSFDGLEKVAGFYPLVGDEADIYSLSRYSDGKVLVGGDFSHADGLPRFGLARLLANGALDPDFHPFGEMPNGWSRAVLALPDGRALAGFGHSNLYLIELDGSLTDLSTFNDYDRVSALAMQADGKALVGSDFGLGVRRLLADFTGVDGAFIPGDSYGAVYSLAVQADGDILVGGDFEDYNNAPAAGLVRLDDDGAIDAGFSPPTFMVSEYISGTLLSLTPLPGGQVLVGGDFTTAGAESHPALARLNSDGSLDAGFTSPADFDTVRSVCLQGDGSIWAGGVEASYFRQPLLRHLQADGGPDSSFQSDFRYAHMDGAVNSLLCESDGVRWAGGRFSLIDGYAFDGLVGYLPLGGRVYLPLTLR